MACKLWTDMISTLRSFSPPQQRNISIYIAGLMCYKFGIEVWNGTLIALAVNRYDTLYDDGNSVRRTFENVAIMQGINQALQCVGSLMVPHIICRFQAKRVMAWAVFAWAAVAMALLGAELGSGGKPGLRPSSQDENSDPYPGGYTHGEFPVEVLVSLFSLCGLPYGIIETMRRVIPRDICGGDVQKLKSMDALVHILYELVGTGAAFLVALHLVPFYGTNFAYFPVPIALAFCGISWLFLRNLEVSETVRRGRTASPVLPPCCCLTAALRSLCGGIWSLIRHCGETLAYGTRIVLLTRTFAWLIPAYSLALYLHRFLENNIAPIIAKRYLGEAAWAQIMVGGSNLGELLGAASVAFLGKRVHTPLPWLRLDAIMLLIVWYLPLIHPTEHDLRYALAAAATFLPMSFGWAAGDVSLNAYVQSIIGREENRDVQLDFSPLAAVMGFLNSVYVITYAVMGSQLGRYTDGYFQEHGSVNGSLIYTVGVQFTVVSILVLAATFVPKHSRAWNPRAVGEQDDKELSDGSPDQRLSTETLPK